MNVPHTLGPFAFPDPYRTQGIRLTNAENAPNGCEPRTYSYWSAVNNHRGRPELSVVVGRVGQSPLVVRVNKGNGAVSTLYEAPIQSNAEGWYFSDTDPDRLYFPFGRSLAYFLVPWGRGIAFTLNEAYGDDLWQAHSSADDTVHSATVRQSTASGPYAVRGAIVYRKGQQQFFRAPDMDECQVDKSGRWLVIQERNENRIVDLETGGTRVISNPDGALGHIDAGDGFMVGEDDQHEPGALVRWDLRNAGAPRLLLHHSSSWGPGMGHVAVRGNSALLSSNETGELILVPFDNLSGTRAVAPGLMASDGSYDTQLRASFDPTGEYACYVTNLGVAGGRFDTLLVRVGAPAPIVVTLPPPPNPGHPGGSMTYEGLGGDAAGERLGAALFADYEEAGQSPNQGMAVWFWRTAYDALTLGIDASVRKHRREWRTLLNLPAEGGTVPNP